MASTFTSRPFEATVSRILLMRPGSRSANSFTSMSRRRGHWPARGSGAGAGGSGPRRCGGWRRWGRTTGSRARPTWSRFRSVLPSMVSSEGTRIPDSPDMRASNRTIFPTSICSTLASLVWATRSATRRRNATSSKLRRSSRRSRWPPSPPRRTSPRSPPAAAGAASPACPDETWATMPRSNSAMRSSSVRKTLPGWGSAWTKPSTRICFR